MEDWVVEVVSRLGVVGVGLLMFAENVFPPLPSEIIMPLAGYLSSQGRMDFWLAVLSGSIGSLAGATLWYWVGLRVSYDRLCRSVEKHGVWWAMTPDDVDRAVEWFRGHGRYSVLLGRLAPLVRTLISVPAGFSRMRLGPFLLLSALGTVVWTGALTYAGLLLGQQFAQVDRYVGPVAWTVIAIAVVSYIYRVVRILRRRRAASSNQE